MPSKDLWSSFFLKNCLGYRKFDSLSVCKKFCMEAPSKFTLFKVFSFLKFAESLFWDAVPLFTPNEVLNHMLLKSYLPTLREKNFGDLCDGSLKTTGKKNYRFSWKAETIISYSLSECKDIRMDFNEKPNSCKI